AGSGFVGQLLAVIVTGMVKVPFWHPVSDALPIPTTLFSCTVEDPVGIVTGVGSAYVTNVPVVAAPKAAGACVPMNTALLLAWFGNVPVSDAHVPRGDPPTVTLSAWITAVAFSAKPLVLLIVATRSPPRVSPEPPATEPGCTVL